MRCEVHPCWVMLLVFILERLIRHGRLALPLIIPLRSNPVMVILSLMLIWIWKIPFCFCSSRRGVPPWVSQMFLKTRLLGSGKKKKHKKHLVFIRFNCLCLSSEKCLMCSHHASCSPSQTGRTHTTSWQEAGAAGFLIACVARTVH